ncbi:hypothetical protein ACFQ1S_04180 [Kibdelosporangium lantanae]|uniref:DNA helicase n=1 Tax=Kibdelosporangium lantanae TaxID=1497396 RepID=A0ABW3M435_9PSEU
MSSTEIEREQQVVSMLYGRLDDLRANASARLSRSLREKTDILEDLSERDTAVATYSDLLSQYNSVENGLCFGRLEFQDGNHQHIGRIGIFDEDNDYEPLLMDWRAPAAGVHAGDGVPGVLVRVRDPFQDSLQDRATNRFRGVHP